MDLTGWWVGGSRAKAWATQLMSWSPGSIGEGCPPSLEGREAPGTAGAE